jgi:hypothetical protein
MFALERADYHMMVYADLKGMRARLHGVFVRKLAFAMRALKSDEDDDNRRIDALKDLWGNARMFVENPANRDLRHTPIKPVWAEDRILVWRRQWDDKHRWVVRRHGCIDSRKFEGGIEGCGLCADNVERLNLPAMLASKGSATLETHPEHAVYCTGFDQECHELLRNRPAVSNEQMGPQVVPVCPTCDKVGGMNRKKTMVTNQALYDIIDVAVKFEMNDNIAVISP